MGLLLNLAYLIGAVIASPWILYRLVFRGDWKGLSERFGTKLGPELRESIWLHGASAGEIALLRPLVERIERDMPARPLLISAYSSTGLAAARQAFPQHHVILFPIDLTFVVSRFLKRFNPSLIVIVESDFWPNFLAFAQRSKTPVAVINGKMSRRSYQRYARTNVIVRLLRKITFFAVQSSEQSDRLLELGVDAARVIVTGNMKYDLADSKGADVSREELRDSLSYQGADVLIIGGSVHEREDSALLDAYLELRSQNDSAALVLVPRYPRDAARVLQLVKSRGEMAVLKTAVDSGEAKPPGGSGVLVVDTLGELRQLYAAADIAFVGGSLFFRGANKGGHNLMEPAILARPVVFGPYHASFKDTVRELLAAEAAIEVGDAEDLARSLTELAGDPERRAAIGDRAKAVVLQGQGATQRNYELLKPLVLQDRESLLVQPFESTMPPAVGDTDT
ncbi:MAG: 3-deoxy-D-manno-octulosonic acid transferase [Gammaproteobacteria bacterium]